MIIFIYANSQAWQADPEKNTLVAANDKNESRVQVVYDGAGGAIIVWEHEFIVGDIDILAQRLDANGNRLWIAGGTAVTSAGGHQKNLQVVSDLKGGAIISWQDYRSGSNNDIYAQRIDKNGVLQWSTGPGGLDYSGILVSNTAQDQGPPQMTSDGLGGAIITWHEYHASTSFDIYAQRIGSNGVLQWGAGGVAIESANSQWDKFPAIASDGAGGAIIAWVYEASTPSDVDYDIRAQRVTAGGSLPWGVPVGISTAGGWQVSPAIASDGQGGAVIVWHDARNANKDIYTQRVNAGGIVQWTTSGIRVTSSAFNEDSPRIATNLNGEFYVTWTEYDSAPKAIYAQRISMDGSLAWNATQGTMLSSYKTGHQPSEIVADGKNGAIVSWYGYGDGSGFDIFAQRINTFGRVWKPFGIAVSSNYHRQTMPALTADGKGGAIIAWQDERRGTYSDIYAQRVYFNGNLNDDGPCFPVNSVGGTVGLICL